MDKRMLLVSVTPAPPAPAQLKGYVLEPPPSNVWPPINLSNALNTRVGEVDRALDSLGDWIRLNSMTWLIWTDWSPEAITARLKETGHPRERALVIRVSLKTLYGSLPNWVWDWIAARRSEIPSAGLGDVQDF
jgi:hypothetical protein